MGHWKNISLWMDQLDSALIPRPQLHDIPDEVARVLEKENIDCDYQKGGVLYVAARYPEQGLRLSALYQNLAKQGYQKQDHQWLEGVALANKIKIPSAQAAVYSPHCASIQPAKLVRALSETVEKLGVKIYEQSVVSEWHKGWVKTQYAQINAKWVVPALEAYGGDLSHSQLNFPKYHLPVQSLMIATEPLSSELWQSIGLEQGEVFSDFSRQVTYGLRTKDNRFVFGARGSYKFGAKLRHEFTLSDDEINLRRDILVELFPQFKDVNISHSWGGNLAMSRQFQPHMMIDLENNFAMAGGFGDEGVGASNLAGRTLADLILGRSTDLVTMPWVNTAQTVKKMKKWEPEPIPWIGSRLLSFVFDREDKILKDPKSPKWKRLFINRLAGLLEKAML